MHSAVFNFGLVWGFFFLIKCTSEVLALSITKAFDYLKQWAEYFFAVLGRGSHDSQKKEKIFFLLVSKEKPKFLFQGEPWKTWTFDSESFDSDGSWSIVQIDTDRSLRFSQFWNA